MVNSRAIYNLFGNILLIGVLKCLNSYIHVRIKACNVLFVHTVKDQYKERIVSIFVDIIDLKKKTNILTKREIQNLLTL